MAALTPGRIANGIVVVIAFVLAAADLAPGDPSIAAPERGWQGWGATTLFVVNRDAVEEANVESAFGPTGLEGWRYEPTWRIPPIGLVRFGPSREFQPGWYAVDANSRQPIAVIASHAWPCTGAACAEQSSDAGRDILVPFIVKQFVGHTSRVSIENTDESEETTVQVELRAAAQEGPVVTASYSVPPGRSVHLSLETDAPFVAVRPSDPYGFVGSLRVVASRPVAVYVQHDAAADTRAGTPAVYDHPGVPRERASNRLHVPLVVQGAARAAALFEQTWLAVANAGDVATPVRVTYHGFAGPCAGQTIVTDGPSLAPTTMSLFRTRFGENTPILPEGCLATATIDGPDAPLVAAVVHLASRNRKSYGNDIERASATLAEPTTAAARDWVAWDWHRQWTSAGGFSEAIVHNPGARTATVVLTPRDEKGAALAGCGDPCRAEVPPGSSRILRAEDTTVLPAGIVGSAVLHSDEPVIVWLRTSSLSGAFDDSLAPAVPIRAFDDPPAQEDGHAYVPVFYQPGFGNGCPPPTRTPTVAPTPLGARPAYMPALHRNAP